VSVKVAPVIVAGFIALLKVAVIMVLGHAPTSPFGGATEITVGGRRLGLVPVLSGSPHAAQETSNRNAMNHVVASLYLGMTGILLPLGSTFAAPRDLAPKKEL
jgi:hypothetical protein